MKNTRKIITISIILSMLIIAFIPLTKVNADVEAINFLSIGYSEETVSADTNLEEYINTKKTELINECAEEGLTITAEALNTNYFNATSDMMSMPFYSKIKLKENGEKDIEITETEALIRLDRVAVIKEKYKISSATVTIAALKAGDKIEVEEIVDGEYTWKVAKTFPTFTTEENANYTCEGYFITAYPSELPDGYDEPFAGTVEEGKEYYVECCLIPKADYEFATNATLTVNGGTNYELSAHNGTGQLMFYTKVKGVAATTPAANNTTEEDKKDETEKITYKMLTEDNQEYTTGNGKDLVLKADGELSKFKGLKIDTKDTDTNNYTKESGSTIIKLKAAFLDTLEPGSHTATLVFEDGEVSTNFKIAKATTTATETATTAATTQGGLANPQTGDKIAIAVSVMMIAVAILSITIFRKKDTK